MAVQRSSWGMAIRRLFLRNAITLAGASITTTSALFLAVFVIVSLLGLIDAPYLGIVAFLILPGFFVAGLLIIPLGFLWERFRKPRELRGAPVLVLDFSKTATRVAVSLVAFLTLMNLIIMSYVSYAGVVYSESVEFCGTVCHTVMEPEHTAYLNSPHSKVKCVECHIGPGAPWFVQAKLSGVRQVFAVLFDTYSRPIPTPVEHLRPSRDICEECHWPERFTGDRMKVKRKFSEDEHNTQLITALLMHVGGGNSDSKGIHSWHIDPDKETLYLPADAQRQTISLVRVKQSDGTITNYSASDFEDDAAALPDSDLRTMDCIDCHNRPTHIYQMPGEALDDAMAHGRIDNTLPYIKKLGVEALTSSEESEDPVQFIDRHIRSYYQENDEELLTSRHDTIESAIKEVQAIFQRNVFPAMNVTWGSYPNNINHIDFPGCFRCHDDAHVSPDGAVVSQDCTACHTVLAWEEEDPEILTTLGID